jgi:hypothetical protein
VLDAVVEKYQEQRAAIVAADKTSAESTKAELREVWGGEEFRVNVDLIKSFLESEIPEALAEAIVTARAANGQRLVNDPSFLTFLLQAARGESSMPSQTPSFVMSEEAELTALMHSDLDTYNFGRWRGTDQRPCDRLLELRRKNGGRK